MLITYEELAAILKKYNISVRGVFHVGAHDCEELELYSKLGLKNEDNGGILWIEALSHKVDEAKERGLKNIYSALITDRDDEVTVFNVSNNVQSSSILHLKTHLIEHPHISYVEEKTLLSVTVDSFAKRNSIDMSKFNMWNFDIQGAELLALKGGLESLKHVSVLYLEVNEKELYEGCVLLPQLDSFLKELEFQRVLTSMTRHGWGDAVYVRKTC